MDSKDKQSLAEFKESIKEAFPEVNFILFGSKVTGRDSESSDIDVLVLLDRQINTALEKKIFDIGFDIGLRHNVVFGIVVEEKAFWNSTLAKAMPFYQNIAAQGLPL